MPTPFQHLVYAEQVLEDARLSKSIQKTLRHYLGAYYLGTTAADVQTLTRQPRIATHFYHLADIGNLHPTEELFKVYPQLANPWALSPDQAAFISGYLVHLSWDEMWAAQVFIPYYMQSNLWPDRLSRSKHHNGLRVLLDRRAEAHLYTQPHIRADIQAATPHNWLPFVPDAALYRWRDWLSTQLVSPENVETGVIFARRMGITSAEMDSIVQQMAAGNYPPQIANFEIALDRFEQCAQWASVQVLTTYWTARPRADEV